MEKLWKLSKAQGGQKWGGAALGIANLVGVLVLQGLLASRSVQATQYAELATALSGPLFLLKVRLLTHPRPWGMHRAWLSQAEFLHEGVACPKAHWV